MQNKDFGKITVGLMKQILMDRFSGILGSGQVEDQKMTKGKLIDGKKLSVGLGVNQSRRLKMLVVNLVIIHFWPKLDKFYCIGAMN